MTTKQSVRVFAIQSSYGGFYTRVIGEWPIGNLQDAILYPSRYAAVENLKIIPRTD